MFSFRFIFWWKICFHRFFHISIDLFWLLLPFLFVFVFTLSSTSVYNAKKGILSCIHHFSGTQKTLWKQFSLHFCYTAQHDLSVSIQKKMSASSIGCFKADDNENFSKASFFIKTPVDEFQVSIAFSKEVFCTWQSSISSRPNTTTSRWMRSIEPTSNALTTTTHYEAPNRGFTSSVKTCNLVQVKRVFLMFIIKERFTINHQSIALREIWIHVLMVCFLSLWCMW